MANPGLGFGVIARTNVDDIVELGVAQKACAGEGTDERHLGSHRDRLRRGRCRRADRTDQREDLVFLDQLLGGDDRLPSGS